MSDLPASVTVPVAGRPKHREVSGLARAGAILFVIGLLAVAVIMVLFAAGSTDLPLWLNLTAMLAPVGFGLGLLGVFREARTSRRAGAVRRAARLDAPGTAGPG